MDRVIDATAFLRDAARWLEEAGPENNHVLGLASGRDADVEFWLVRDARGELVGAAGRRGRRPLGITRLDDAARGRLVDHLEATGVELSGVVGPRPDVDRFVKAWGGPCRLRMEQQVYAATSPIARAAAPPGAHVRPGDADRAELVSLVAAFFDETGMPQPAGSSEQLVADRLKSGDLHVWRRDGVVVSFAVLGGFTPKGARIDVLYTRRDHRQHGYAVALVREVTNEILVAGRSYCVVYADRRSSPANAVYQHLGFDAVFESRLYELGLVSAGREGDP